MKNIIFIIFCLTLGLLIGCVNARSQIVSGVYQEPAGAETITIDGESISFQIYIAIDNQRKITSRNYNYTLRSDGSIHVIASSNDSVFIFGIMRYHWFWDGKYIMRKDSKTGDITRFTLRKS